MYMCYFIHISDNEGMRLIEVVVAAAAAFSS